MKAWLRDVAVLTRRNLIRIGREPMQLSDATVQPVLFTLLFVTLFGAAMVIPGGGSYKAFAIGGLVTMNLTTAAMGTAVGLASDLSTGVMDRFRTLPMARSAVLAGRTVTDGLAGILCGSIVLLTGLAIGWRPGHGLPGTLAGLGVAVVFAYALSWFTACIGLAVSDPESAQAVGMLTLFPLAFVSSCFVPTQGLPHWLAVVADWNPVSAVAGACRNLFGNPNPAALTHTFPATHPLLLALGWSAAIIAVCAPLASRRLRLRTTD
ncbi:MAG TPA: ABC transporter permease [Acidimicrobiia bacterium]|nr:ABC transporter permease [Acidimicrobiia bacterium]